MGLSFMAKYCFFLIIVLLLSGATYEEILQDKKNRLSILIRI